LFDNREWGLAKPEYENPNRVVLQTICSTPASEQRKKRTEIIQQSDTTDIKKEPLLCLSGCWGGLLVDVIEGG
jgi:hypothetical protein